MSMTASKLESSRTLADRAVQKAQRSSSVQEPSRKFEQNQWEQFQQIITEAKSDLQTARDKLTSAYHRLDSVSSFVSPSMYEKDGHEITQAIQELGQAVTELVDYSTQSSKESSSR